MKRIPIVLVLVLAALPAAAQTNPTVSLQWHYPISEVATNCEFLVFTSPGLTPPITNWTFVTNLSSLAAASFADTNAVFRVRVPVHYGPQFWTVAVYDPFWGTNFFDVSAGTNSLPRLNQPIVIER